jgi:hypothetical protein
MATAFISVGAYYAYPQRLKISRDCRIKGKSGDELLVPWNQKLARRKSLPQIEALDART